MLLHDGHALVYDFSYEIHCEEQLPPSVEVSPSDGVVFRVYAPFVLSRVRRAGDEVDLTRIPHLANARPPSQSLPRIQAVGTTTWPTPSVIANALRIDAFGAAKERSVELASTFIPDFTQWIRWACRQWWIGIGHSEANAPLVLTFPIDGLGQGQNVANAHVTVMPWLGGECRLSSDLFQACALLAASGRHVPLAGRLLLDGLEAFLRQRYHQSALLLAQAVECAIETVLTDAVNAGTLQRGVQRTALQRGFESRLDEGLSAAVGESFRAADSSSYEALCRLWILRHAVAHADLAQLSLRDNEFSREQLNQCARSVARFFEWLAQITDAPVDHWLAACRRPIIV